MIRPHPCAFICGTASRAVWNAAERLSAMIASHFAGGKSSTGATCCIPALLTSTSTGPAAAIIASAPSVVVRPPATYFAPSSPQRRSISLPLPKPLSPPSAPSAASARAIARPIPEVEPVTSARLPERNMVVSLDSDFGRNGLSSALVFRGGLGGHLFGAHAGGQFDEPEGAVVIGSLEHAKVGDHHIDDVAARQRQRAFGDELGIAVL